MKKKTQMVGWAAAALLLFGPGPAWGQQGEIEALREEVRALQARLEVLEALKPTFTGFMPNFSERFHVMHRAGEAGDWAVAQHELLEMRRMVKVAQVIDPVNGKLMEGFLSGNLERLSAAIEHGNQKKFRTALEDTVVSCNQCHTAVGSPFIEITLKTQPTMTMRHPHALRKSKVMAGHAHKE